MSGWVKVSCDLDKWEWYGDINTCRVFVHLLIKANYKTANWRDILVKRGQLVTTVAELAGKTNLTQQKVRTALANLQRSGTIKIQTTNKYTLLTLVNYGKYQDKFAIATNKSDIKSTNDLTNKNRVKHQTHAHSANKQRSSQETNKKFPYSVEKPSVLYDEVLTLTNKNRVKQQTKCPDVNKRNAYKSASLTPNKITNRGGIIGGEESTEGTEGTESQTDRKTEGTESSKKTLSSVFLSKKEGIESSDPEDVIEGQNKIKSCSFESIPDTWWPSRPVCSAMLAGGFMDSAIKTIRERFIRVCNRQGYTYPDLDKGFLNFAETYAFTEGMRNGLDEEQVIKILQPVYSYRKKRWGR